MTSEIWLCLNATERALLREALSAYAVNGDREAAKALSQKIVMSAPHPDITVRVYGGVVQGITGNPFPIRVCDYDGDEDMDEEGEPCTMGFEQPALG
jgi:hypothetical protein